MYRIPRAVALGLLLIGVTAITACTNKVAAPAPEKPAVRAPTGGFDPNQPVTVAFLSPLSAQNPGAAALGRALANAAQMSANSANDPLMVLRVYDTAGDPTVAASVAEQALAEGAKLILGPLFATSTGAAGRVAKEKGVRVIAFSTDSTVAGDPVYLSGFLPEMEARRIVQFARGRGYERIGLFYPDTALGQVASAGARSTAEEVGVAVVSDSSYVRTVDGIRDSAQAFVPAANAAGAQAYFLPDSGDGLRTVGAFLKSNGLSRQVKLLGLGQWNAKATLQESALRGGWFPSPDPASMRRFVADYRRVHRSTPPALAVLGYDAVQIAAQLLRDARQAGSNDAFGVAAITRPQGFVGAVGPIRFRPDGLGERGLAILEVGPATFTTLAPAPASFAAGGS